jgi:Asp-tRNA(Asn)/Glu-tRNA(Gln) amidotransferase A subunit family amidase
LKFIGAKRFASFFKNFNQKDINFYGDLVIKRQVILDDFQEKWKKEKYDAILLPTYPTAAFRNAESGTLANQGFVCGLVNGLGACAGTVPITVVEEGEEFFQEPYYNDVVTKAYRTSMKTAKGMPIGIQVICAPWKDEQALAVMKVIEDLTKFSEKHPLPKY